MPTANKRAPLNESDVGPNEETALLRPTTRTNPRTPTPLPKAQIAILLMLQLSEPMSSQVIYPFIAQLVSELPVTGGDKRKVGYYAGLIESLFFATEALFVFHWSHASDYVGRKPVLLVGLIGLCASMIGFGLSKTFWALVASRCLSGMLNGNIGVMKTMMGEITDSTNRARGFSLMPVVWAAGATFGPFVGGTLARPHERFPNVFSSSFWEYYPYLLPCLASATFSATTLVITVLFLKETIHEKKLPKFLHVFQRKGKESGNYEPHPSPPQDPTKEPLPLRKLMVFPVLISIANYCFLAFIDIMLAALRPLFLAQPIEIGGFDLPPSIIGLCLGGYGLSCGIFQAFFFARIVDRFGPKLVYLTGILTSIPIFLLFPVINAVARKQGHSPLAWALLVFQLSLSSIMDMSYGCVFIYITASSPNTRSLGAVNGMAQTTASIARACGPALVSSLFSFSQQYDRVFGGNAVYVFLVAMAVGGLMTASPLPKRVWTHRDESESD